MSRRQPVVLETRDLSVRFGGVTAVDRVSFKLRNRELRCLIGPNGAGKSTFFKCLTGQLRPSEGEVLIRDAEVAGLPPHAIARLGVGIKTQVPSLFDGLSVHENIWLAARHERSATEADRAVADTVERLRLGDLLRATVGQLAHGQRQTVEIAMVLAQEPWLVLLDEPAAGMTHEEVVRLAELIREINRSATVIVVDHDMQFIRMIAEKVTVLAQGAVLMEDGMDAVVADPRVREVYLGKHAADLQGAAA